MHVDMTGPDIDSLGPRPFPPMRLRKGGVGCGGKGLGPRLRYR